MMQIQMTINQNFQLFREETERRERDRLRREAEFQNKIAEMEALILSLQQNSQHQQRQQQQRQQQFNRNFPQREEGNRGFWTPPEIRPSEDTPITNKYLERIPQLNEAQREGRSLAIAGAKVKFVEERGDLCEAKEKVKIHAVGGDLRMGVGVAKTAADTFGKPDVPEGGHPIGTIVKQSIRVGDEDGEMWHAVVKEKSHHKIYKNPEAYLAGVHVMVRKIREAIEEADLKEVAMSNICSGTDHTHRLWVMELLHQELKDVDVTIHFYNIRPSKRWDGATALFRQSGGEAQTSESEEDMQLSTPRHSERLRNMQAGAGSSKQNL
jgi:TolA-binding protein